MAEGQSPYDFAIQMEKEGEALYRRAAELADKPAVKKIFQMLADDEVDHANVIKAIKDSGEIALAPIPRGTPTVFAELKAESANDKSAFICKDDVVEILRRSITAEDESAKFYRQRGAAATSDAEKAFYRGLEMAEIGHGEILIGLMEFFRGEWEEGDPETDRGTADV